MAVERELIQLPNKDLWRGYHPEVEKPDNVDGLPTEPAKIDSAMAQILKSSAGASTLTCIWCGQQADSATMREHLRQLHPSKVSPPSEGEMALAAATLGIDTGK